MTCRRNGRNFSEEPWLSFRLTPSQYGDLQRLLQADKSLRGYVEDKVRYDYFPSAKQFVLRRLKLMQEALAFEVVRDIRDQLNLIARGDSQSAIFAQDIIPCGSADIIFTDPDYGRHDPDAQFIHSRARYPGVVIEVCHSQKRRDLARLADEYILGSDGRIRVVVGLDIESTGKRITLSIWRPQILITDSGVEELIAEQTVIDQVVRNEDGTPNLDPETGLRLQLEDFAPEPLVENYGNLRDTLFIPFTNLCAHLKVMEDRQSTIKDKVVLLKPGTRIRKRASTPLQELGSDSETRFQEDEHRASQQAACADTS